MGQMAVQAHDRPLTEQFAPDGQHVGLTLPSRSGMAAWPSHARGPTTKGCSELSQTHHMHAATPSSTVRAAEQQSAPPSLAHSDFEALHTASLFNAIACHQRNAVLPQAERKAISTSL